MLFIFCKLQLSDPDYVIQDNQKGLFIIRAIFVNKGCYAFLRIRKWYSASPRNRTTPLTRSYIIHVGNFTQSSYRFIHKSTSLPS